MSDVAVRIEGISKRYHIGSPELDWYKTLRGTLTKAAAAPVRALSSNLRRLRNGSDEDIIWALKDVTFEVKEGEVVGLIGHNGAGKSTLLKILSRITEPTEGYAEIHGRISSLLEVGTGFHAELSGRENLYLNGAILGMKKAEIKRKFDEIVAFAGVGKFIDTPVKHYSSGMYLRLAFAVSAHLEPEILMVDEVLAVGDAEFQKKCLGKMGDVASQGKTVILVSHNMAAITNLCSRTAVLKAGQLHFFGDTQSAIAEYINALPGDISPDLSQRDDREGWGRRARLQRMTLLDRDGSPKEVVQSGEPLIIAMEYLSSDGRPLESAFFEVKITTQFGELLFTLSTHLTGQTFSHLPSHGTIYCYVPAFLVAPGLYNTSVFLYVNNGIEDRIHNASRITVIEGDFFGSGKTVERKKHGTLMMPQSWYRTLPPANKGASNNQLFFEHEARAGVAESRDSEDLISEVVHK